MHKVYFCVSGFCGYSVGVLSPETLHFPVLQGLEVGWYVQS
jgi:hypothetical protein